ncbi:MAG: hypothetical protein IAE77_25255 [Prosthecobacter sp.]|jgi:hypothetical protein|uniref:hypothetical protein n=1 Tax=Prosthecobacter sp. TaxID=1965333 RepID=UPI001A108142|nr:hypothetical protein [Prosthecobacter sp.]MBE2286790.1 hypothetical protein [Prosthecobacter sp.]
MSFTTHRTLRFLTSLWVVGILAAVCPGCGRSDVGTGDLAERFDEALRRSQEIVFVDRSNLGASWDGAIVSLHFFPDSKVHLYTWGNGFSNHAGTYEFTKNNGLTLSLTDQSWPPLRLLAEGDSFVLERQDGLTSLTRSHILTDPNGVRRKMDDADIYPQARSLIFPLVQRTEPAKSGGR